MHLEPYTLVASRYRIIKALGEGGLGSVFLAQDQLLERDIALKIVELDRREDLEAFRREFSTLAGLFHPSLALVYAFGPARIGGRSCVFYTSRHIEGVPIDIAARERPWAEMLPGLVDGLSALRFLHRAGIRHGDFKPDNLLIGRSGRGTLIDLSCSGEPSSGTVSGTIGYIAPEQLAGSHADHRADLYAVGRTLEAVTKAVVDGPDLSGLIGKLTHEDPSERPGDVDEVLAFFGVDATLDVEPGQRPSCVGRHHETALHGELIRQLSTGEAGARALLFYGPEGIGRSRLLQECTWLAQLEVEVIEGDARHPDSIVEILCRALGKDVDADQNMNPRVAIEGVLDREDPLLIVLDDTEELLDDQRSLLRVLLQHLTPTSPVALLLSHHSAPSLIDGLEAPVVAVQLEPLDLTDIESWLQSIERKYIPRGRIEELHSTTRGRPREIHSLLSVIRSGTEDFTALLRSRSLSDRATARKALRALESDARRLLGICAALDGELQGWILESLDVPPTTLSSLLSEGWLVREDGRGGGGGQVGQGGQGRRGEFRLARLSDATSIADALGKKTMSAIHREVATWIEPMAYDGASRAALITHRALSGAVKRAERMLLESRAAFPHSPREFRKVAEILVTLRPSTDTALVAAELNELCGDPRRAADLVDGLDSSQPGVSFRRGSAYLLLGDAQKARTHLLLALEGEVEQAERARIADLLCRVMIQAGEYGEAQELADKALSWSEIGDIEGELLEDLGVALTYLGHADDARKRLEESERINITLDRPRSQVRALSYGAILEYRLGRYRDAVGSYQRALEIAETGGLVDQVVSCALNLGTVLHRLGDWGNAHSAYLRGLEMAIAVGGNLRAEVALRSNLAQLHCDTGRFERAAQVLNRAQSLCCEAGLPFFEATCEMLLGEITLFRGQPLEAVARFQLALELFESQGTTRELADVKLLLCESALALGDHSGARAHLDVAKHHAERSGASDLESRANLLEGRLALGLGNGPQALQWLEGVLPAAEGQQELDLLAEIEAWLAEAYERRGAPRAARRHRERALELWERCSATLPEEQRDLVLRHPRRAHIAPDVPDEARQEPSRGKSTREVKLERLLAINARLTSSLKSKEVLDATMDAAVELTGAERGFLILSQDVRHKRDRLKVAVARNIDKERIGRSSMKFSRSIAEKVLQNGEPLLTAEALNDDRFATTRSVQAMALKSVMSVPIRGPEGILGALYVDNRFGRGLFSQEDLEILMGFADQAGIALTNARLHDELDARTRELERERRRIAKTLEDRTKEVDILSRQVLETRQAFNIRGEYKGIIGRSRAMQTVFATIDRVAPSSFTVLIQGESGTGKELIARAVHHNSPRSQEPFVTVNCGAIPETLLESELFGHRRGAFTGADHDRDGLLVHAGEGTIFLDEIGELPLGMQTKLLRALQEREVLPLGSTHPRSVSARILCATNRRLLNEVEAGRFREDLYYRLAVVVIEVPPLRERLDDIPELVRHLLERLSVEADRPLPAVTPGALRQLLGFHYPGNVRQLENILSQALVFCSDGSLDTPDIVLPDVPRRGHRQDYKEFQATEASEIAAALRSTRWNITEVSRLLSIPRTSLYRKLKRYGLVRNKEGEIG